MFACPACEGQISDQETRCPSCGAAVEGTPTRPAPDPAGPAASSELSAALSGSSWSSSSGDARAETGATDQRFVPGQMVAGRYRIVSLLGRGGMGEVYRADDLTLHLPVALKFLPEASQRDPGHLARFYHEVRVAREVSHPAVCRVHDVGNVAGMTFLSMELVDGEDLASLTRRIGRLPYEKGLDIAHQLCAGLAAAHGKGILHRDLKPQNVMLDERGKVRITDFGLAGLQGTFRGDELRAGTPAYMAPEQLAGREVSARSDLYALGLVLYELFTGRRPFAARSLAELVRRQREELPSPPSAVIEGLDPAVDRAVMRCLETDPSLRPGSAVAVAALLPGGDPLAAALLAGDTPAPEVVAAASSERAVAVATLRALTAVIVVATTLAVAWNGSRDLLRHVPLDKPPAVLEDRARAILAELGVSDRPVDTARGLTVDWDYLRWIEDNDRSPRRWERLQSGPPSLLFWYRESPRALVSRALWGRVDRHQPALSVSGMTWIALDTTGRLVELEAAPAQRETAASGPRGMDWGALFEYAQLDPEAFRAVEPLWVPLGYADERRAWEGRFPEAPQIPLRVEAAAYRGHPVSFRLIGPWSRAERESESRSKQERDLGDAAGATILLSVIGASVLMARSNLRAGRGDRRGAVRLALVAFVTTLTSWTLGADHASRLVDEMPLAVRGVAQSLLVAAVIWLLYVALEPPRPATLASCAHRLGSPSRQRMARRARGPTRAHRGRRRVRRGLGQCAGLPVTRVARLAAARAASAPSGRAAGDELRSLGLGRPGSPRPCPGSRGVPVALCAEARSALRVAGGGRHDRRAGHARPRERHDDAGPAGRPGDHRADPRRGGHAVWTPRDVCLHVLLQRGLRRLGHPSNRPLGVRGRALLAGSPGRPHLLGRAGQHASRGPRLGATALVRRAPSSMRSGVSRGHKIPTSL